MAFSWLGNPIISRTAPSLFRVCFLSSYASLRSPSRTSNVESHFKDLNGSWLSRPNSLSTVMGEYNTLNLKLQIGVRHFSSTTDLHEHTVPWMPVLSPTMSKSNIAKWKKKGDKIEACDVVCGIETDKTILSLNVLKKGF